MRQPVLFFLFFLTMFSVAARAQDNILPEAIRDKIWVLPDCENPAVVFFFGKRFTFQLMPGMHLIARITDIRPAESGPGAWEIRQGVQGGITALRALDSGTLLYSIPISMPFADIEQPARAEEDNDFLLRLVQCPDLPEAIAVNGDMKAAFAAFERADEICAGKKIAADESCRRAVFDIADADADGALNVAELARLWGYIAWLAESRTCGDAAPSPPESGTAADGAKFATQALAVADADKSGSLTLKEIETFQPAFAVTGDGVKLRAMLDSAALVMDWAK